MSTQELIAKLQELFPKPNCRRSEGDKEYCVVQKWGCGGEDCCEGPDCDSCIIYFGVQAKIKKLQALTVASS